MTRKNYDTYWPRRGDFADHIEWFLEKNPEKTRREAIEFARCQMGHQIAINHMNIRILMGVIREELEMIERMAVALEKGEGSASQFEVRSESDEVL